MCHKEYDGDITVCPDDGTALAHLSGDDLIGKLFVERYQIIEPIGGGGMGKVYKAKHLLMNRLVAIKVLRKDVIATTDTLKRFRVEAQAASALSLPNILAVYDFGISADGQAYMVMDYLDGRGLNDILEKEGKLSVQRALPIFIQICQGLEHAHAKGIIHRDIKPGNIMIVKWEGQDDFVKIVDFGIAKLLNEDSDSINLTRTGEVFGSPLYMSPEQWKGHKLDFRTDIFSLGCIMYRALSGKTVFQTENAFDAMYKQVHEVPVPLCTLCPDIPIELDQIVMKAIAKDADSRYQSMSDLKLALEQVRDSIVGNSDGAVNAGVVDTSTVITSAVTSGAVNASTLETSALNTNATNSGTVNTFGAINLTAAPNAVPVQSLSQSGPIIVAVTKPGDTIEITVPPGTKNDETFHFFVAKRWATWIVIAIVIAIGGFTWAALQSNQPTKTQVVAPPPAPPLPAGINGVNPATVDNVVVPRAASPNDGPAMQPLPAVKPLSQAPPQPAINNGERQERISEPAVEHSNKHARAEKREHATTAGHEKKRGIVGKLKKLFGKL
jgi:serine/threonine protein kinase